MKFLVDAQLPRKLALWLREEGHDAVHTFDLPDGNRTTDLRVNHTADVDARVVVSKDSDFVDSFLLRREPAKLLLVSTGNLTNHALERLFRPQISAIVAAFELHHFVELTTAALLIHQ